MHAENSTLLSQNPDWKGKWASELQNGVSNQEFQGKTRVEFQAQEKRPDLSITSLVLFNSALNNQTDF